MDLIHLLSTFVNLEKALLSPGISKNVYYSFSMKMPLKEIFSIFFQPKVSVVLKRLDDCMKFKEEGNVLFKANSPAEAKDMYTKGI